jgi:geranylgeranyl diphosphate synthase, type I
MLRYHMGWQDERGASSCGESGKFVRSTLCLLSCEAAGGDASEVIPAAAAVELIHNFSLIHDDIEDDSYERHHRPAVWRVWGHSQAINAGDAMFALAYLALQGLEEQAIGYQRISGATEALSQACLDLCEGQYLDLKYEHRLDVTVEEYLYMAGKKTAALLAVASLLGAYLGGGHGGMVDCLNGFGRELGMAYQICDDLMGIWGREERTGKTAGDISRKKKSLPVVYGLLSARGEDRERLETLYAQRLIEERDVAEVVRILEQTGARDYAQNLAEEYHRKAVAQLGAAGLEAGRQTPLRELACFLLQRDF